MTIKEKKILNDKYLGGFLTATIGDVLGWPQEQNSKNISTNSKRQIEFQTWKKITGTRFHLHEEVIHAGEYSDDTQLMLATARSLLKKEKWYVNFAKVELPFWLLYERGGGGATKRACKSWANGVPPWKSSKEKELISYFNAGGNGVVMRILPHIFNSYKDKKKLMHDIFRNGIATHGHPRALVSSLAYAQALLYLIEKEETLRYAELIDYLLESHFEWSIIPELEKMEDWYRNAELVLGLPYQKIWDSTVEEFKEGLVTLRNNLKSGLLDDTEKTLTNLGCFDKKINGSGNVTVLIALYIFSKYATNPKTGLLELAYLKNADTDTLASVAGGLFGTLHGTEWIPDEWLRVQDYDYIKHLVNISLMDLEIDIRVTDSWKEAKRKKLLENLSNREIGSKFSFHVFQSLELVDKYQNRMRVNKFQVETYKLKTGVGQTIYVKSTKQKSLENNIEKINVRIDKENIKFDTLVSLSKIIPNVELAKSIQLLRIIYEDKNSNIYDFKKKLSIYELSKIQLEEIYNLFNIKSEEKADIFKLDKL
ncbi:ADP-ribosylglycohydrolase family protein [Lysinibacillus sp. NPDC094403]|uniref:ADP-ribosylglycohydrolase family protein n=1 Tax=Lysinibacillus sp. NPDC094403 TaxID=3390581 RepID=UPI003D040774